MGSMDSYQSGNQWDGGTVALSRPTDPSQGVSSSPARDRISSAESWLSDSHQALDALEKRLDTILTPVPPIPPGTAAQNTPTPIQSHVVGRLVILNDGYAHLVDRIQRLIARVEL